MAYSEFGRRDSYYPHRHVVQTTQIREPSLARRIATWLTVLTLTAWSGMTTFYIYFHDDALKLFVAHQTKMVQSYDAQLTTLEGEIERLKSLKLLDQERIDRAVSELARRQAVVEQRQGKLTNLMPRGGNRAESAGDVTGSIPPADSSPPQPAQGLKPSPISDVVPPVPARERSAEFDNLPATAGTVRFADNDRSLPAETRIGKLRDGLAQIEVRQRETLNRLEQAYDERERRIRTVFSDLNITAPSSSRKIPPMGGPFIPLTRSSDAFDEQMMRVETKSAVLLSLDSVLDTTPVRYPVPRGSEITSGFGVRADPFFHQAALHSGVDFRGNPGDAVRATAEGIVTNASNQGGYGQMVEIDHGNGLVTRYGHLSTIEVDVGQQVRTGDIVGRVGTTGRSTGPHLHYEVRVAGEATDPMRYLRAGLQLEAQ